MVIPNIRKFRINTSGGNKILSTKNEKIKVFVVPHFHYDTDWVMTEVEYAEITSHHIYEVLKILDKDPKFKFILDQQVLLEHFYAKHPTLWETLKKRILENRIGLVCGMYIMPDSNLPSIESEIRQILIGKRFMKKEFGKDIVVGWMIDPFGHHAQTPQLFRKAGFKYYAFQRGYKGEPIQDFRWVGLDGSEIIAHYFIYGYGNAAVIPEDLDYAVDNLKVLAERERECSKTPNILLMNGSDFAPPNKDITKIVDEFNKRNTEYQAVISTPEEFFKEIEKYYNELPIIRGEMQYGQYQPILQGCYSSRIWVKQRFRYGEFLLYDSESLATLSWLLGNKYPSRELDVSWKYLLHNAFHDIICGCGIDEIYEDATWRFNESERIAQEVMTDSVNKIVEKIDTETEGAPFIVFNTLPYERNEVTVAEIDVSSLKTKSITLLNSENKKVNFEILEQERDDEGFITRVKLLFVASDLPSFGYEVYQVQKAEGEELPQYEYSDDNYMIENEFFTIEVDPETGLLTSIFDKLNNFEVLEQDAHELEVATDAGDLYNIFEPPKSVKFLQGGTLILYKILNKQTLLRDFADTEVYVTKSSVRQSIHIEGFVRWRDDVHIIWHTIVSLYKGIPRIDFETDMDFNYPHSIVRVHFPVSIDNDVFYSEIPGGVVVRSTKPEGENTWVQKPTGTWPIQNWLDFEDSKGTYGVTFINLGLPEHKIEDNDIQITLLRSVDMVSWGDAGPKIYAPEALMIGNHNFRYALYPHKGRWKDAKSHIMAYSHNVSPIAVQADRKKGPLPRKLSFLRVSPDNIVITAIKKAEDDNSLIVRLFETYGKETKITMEFTKPVKEVYVTNLLEEKENQLTVKNKELSVSLKPFEICTLNISF